MHRLPAKLLESPVDVVVVGAGGTGSCMAGGLPWLHQSMLAFGHPHGIRVTVVDPDTVSPSNCVRQAFSESEIGMPKATVVVSRINMFFGYNWTAVPERLGAGPFRHGADIVIGCVDTRASRREIAAFCRRRQVSYWLDLGNDSASGQFLLGQPENDYDFAPPRRLPTVADMFPELVDPTQDDDTQPSCSAAEALTRQAPFINQVLANHALFMLADLFRRGRLEHHGAFVNPRTGHANPIPVPPVTLSKRQLRHIEQLRVNEWPRAMALDAYALEPEELDSLTKKALWAC